MEQIYLGRIVAFAVTPDGRPAALYRVSSRSFPNREARILDNNRRAAIVPKSGHEPDIAQNPFIAYNCARLAGKYAVLANGSHADPAADMMAKGVPAKEALALSLLTLDYEKDDYATPRIVVAAEAGSRAGWLGSVRKDGIDVRSFSLEPGRLIHVSTYGHDVPDVARCSDFTAGSAPEACSFLFRGGVFAGFSHPVTAVAAVAGQNGFGIARLDAAP
ncbi:MAG: IMP cyclohydrolase [Planctomycetota bacterium]|jgi:IMP cyclohydrolase|nr:IMP cyclohydrolase [Planctomycetota bacterium]